MSSFPSSTAPISLASVEALPAALATRQPLSSAKAASAAGEFESILLGQWLAGAESSFASVPGGQDDEDSGDEQMRSFATQALAKGLSAAGGVGLAPLLCKALTAKGNDAQSVGGSS